jgi:hypothetical protein
VPAFGLPDGNAYAAARRLPTTPFFVLPYKRFATPCLIQPTERFLRDSQDEDSNGDQPHHAKVGYRDAVKHNRQRVGYPIQQASLQDTETAPDKTPSEAASFHQPIIDHSLIWRMVGWLGGLTFALDTACRMILQRNPNSLCHRYTSNIRRAKARSDQRQKTLETADHLLRVIVEWEAIFGEKFFPRFATRSGFD